MLTLPLPLLVDPVSPLLVDPLLVDPLVLLDVDPLLVMF